MLADAQRGLLRTWRAPIVLCGERNVGWGLRTSAVANAAFRACQAASVRSAPTSRPLQAPEPHSSCPHLTLTSPLRIAVVESLLLPRTAAMASPDVHHLFHHPIADHSFSADRQTLAVARDNVVDLFQRSGSKYTLQDELTGHDKTVTGVDIAPNSAKIVTCSQGTAPRPRRRVPGR